jgi:hypothetical protein
MNIGHAFIAAPLLVLSYGLIRIVDGFDGSRGPGLAWTTGHLAFLAALAVFVPILRQLRTMAGRGLIATIWTVIALAGIAALTVQFVIDIVVGFLAADHAEMARLSGLVSDVPGVEAAVYAGGPSLFYTGMLALFVELAVRRQVAYWIPVLVLVGSVLPIIDKDLLPIGAALLLISYVPVARRLLRARPADVAALAGPDAVADTVSDASGRR